MDSPQQWLHHLINSKAPALPYGINPRIFLSLSLWNIWLTRNKNIYEQTNGTVSAIYTIQQAIEFYYLAALSFKKPLRVKIVLKWIPPKPNIYKLNINGAQPTTLNLDGIGGMIRNHLGDWIIGFSGNKPRSTPMAAELEALIQGLQIAIQFNLTPLKVELDAKEVITMLDNDNIIYNNMLFDCRQWHLLQQLHSPQIQHAYGEQNRLAG